MDSARRVSLFDIRDNQNIGAAWRRCKKALPFGWDLELCMWGVGFRAVALSTDVVHRIEASGEDEAAALTSLAETLETL